MELLKRKRLFNSGRAKRKRTNSGKRLSLRQKLFFGTKKQRSAAKSALSNSGRRKTKRRVNVGQIITVDLVRNPGTKKRRNRRANTGIMATRKRRVRRVNAGVVRRRRRRNAPRSWSGLYRKHYKRKNTGARRRRRVNPGVTVVRRRRRNTGVVARRRTRRINSGLVTRRRRRNSGVARRMRRYRNSGSGITGAFKQGLGLVAGAIGTSFGLAQLTNFMPSVTSGPLMYVAGLAVALAESWLVRKVLKKPALANDILTGGIVMLVVKALSQYFPSLSTGFSGFRGMGLIGPGSFTYPQVNVPGNFGQFQIAPDYQNAINASTQQLMSKGMSGIQLLPSGGGRAAMRRGPRLQ